MVKKVESSFVSGPDDNLAAQDLYKVNPNEIVNTEQEKTSKTVPGAKLDKEDIKTVSETTSEQNTTTTTASSKVDPNASTTAGTKDVFISSESISSGLDNLENDLGGFFGNNLVGMDKEDNLKNFQQQLFSGNGLISERGRGVYVMDFARQMSLATGLGLPTNCDVLRGRFNGGRGLMLLLLLAGLFALLLCLLKELIEEYFDSFNDPLVKKAAAALALGSFIKPPASDPFDDVKITENSFESKMDKTKVTKDTRFNNTGTTTNYETNAVEEDKEWIEPYRGDYQDTVQNNNNINLSNKSTKVTYGGVFNTDTKEDSDKIKQNKRTDPVPDIHLINRMLDESDSDVVAELYPDLVENILIYYRMPNDGPIDVAVEYDKLTALLARINPTWYLVKREGNYISTVSPFTYASLDALYLFINHPTSMFRTEALMGRSYYRNDVKTLLRTQYPHSAL